MRRRENVQWLWWRELFVWSATPRRAEATRVGRMSSGPWRHHSTAARHRSSMSASVAGRCTWRRCHGSSTIWLGIGSTAWLIIRFRILRLRRNKSARHWIEYGSITKILLVVVLNIISRSVHGRGSGIIEVLLIERSNSVRPLFGIIRGIIRRERSKAH